MSTLVVLRLQAETNGAKNSVSVKAEPVGVAVFPLISV